MTNFEPIPCVIVHYRSSAIVCPCTQGKIMPWVSHPWQWVKPQHCSATRSKSATSVLPLAVSVDPVYHPERPPQVLCPLSILSLSNMPSAPTVPICCLSLARFLSTRLIDETWWETQQCKKLLLDMECICGQNQTLSETRPKQPSAGLIASLGVIERWC